MRLLLILLLQACLFAQTGSLRLLTGTWVNERETRGVTQVIVRRDGARTIVHAWGSCQPTDCDWGETDADLWNGVPVAIWKPGFATIRMQLIPLPDGRMIVASESEFNDGSGRKDPGLAEFFRQQEIKSDSHEAIRARALLRQTAETYRNLPASYFAAISTKSRTTEKTEVRTVTQEKIFSAPPNKIRVEFDGPGESSLLIADGVSEWIVYPKANQYETHPQPQGPLARGPLSRYVQLDSIRGDPSIVGFEDVQSAGCTVARIALDHGVTEQLWIDNTTHLVRKETLDEDKVKEETVFTAARLGEAGPPDAFVYDPAATNAKNRIELAKAAPETLIGKAAPDFSLRDLEGRTVDLRALRGQPVLLDFWATWCGYCLQALPSLELLHRGLKDKVVVFGIDNEEPELAREYLQKYGYTLRTLVDRKNQAVNLYHVNGWPTTVLIDSDGKIVFYGDGFEPEKLRDALRGVSVW
jgi:thiol-disulfide isomerase/thioredoxin/outer membrane lipoprotein-sorting protein